MPALPFALAVLAHPMSLFLNRTVVLADDQSPVRQQLGEILRRQHCLVVAEASNTDDLIERCDRLRPDAVLMDVTLPGSYGSLVAIQRLRRLVPHLVVLTMGSASQNAMMMESLTMGASDFLIKPLHARSVEQCLQRNL